MRKKFLFPVLCLLTGMPAYNQTLGGNTVYNFLDLSNTPQLTALGGINISGQTDDIGLSFNNPALLRKSMHTQANFVFNAFYAGIRNEHLLTGFYYKPWQTNIAAGVNYFTYGTIPETDAAGNVLGSFKPVDYVVQLSASRQYEAHWHYGASIKFIHSAYSIYRSSGVALDVGINYIDTVRLFQVGLVAKNMGTQLKTYTGGSAEELPFDLELGISKRLAKAPVQFSLTAHHLQTFDIRYEDTAFNNNNGFEQNTGSRKFIFDKVFRHIVLAAQFYIGDRIELTLGYNHLRRKELNISNAGNGLNGYSLGVGVLLKQLQIRYARTYYQNNSAYQQLGINLRLDSYFGLGKWGEKIGW